MFANEGFNSDRVQYLKSTVTDSGVFGDLGGKGEEEKREREGVNVARVF